MRESLEPVRAGTERIASITRELRSFSRPVVGTTLVDVQAAVESVLKLVGKELESRAEAARRSAEDVSGPRRSRRGSCK